MGRRSHSRALSIWANGERIGTWRIPARGDMELQYEDAWMKSPAGRPLSLSLPFGVDTSPLKGEKVASYFDNLLPDSPAIRKRLASRFQTGSTEVFDLLEAVGRDCAGAVQLLAEDGEPEGFHRIEGTPLSDDQIAAHLQKTVATPGMGQDAGEEEFRIALAGAQEKTALLRHRGRWLMPRGATPTTHIFKLPLGLVGNMKADLRPSVENEWLCMNLLKAFGLPVASTQILDFAGQRVLGVERFDRQLHSKNFSIQLLAGGRYRLTPLYDVMSAWPIIGDGSNNWSWHKAKLAMAVAGKNRHYHLKDIQRRHFNAMAAKCGYGGSAEPLIQKLIERVPGAIEEVKARLPPGFPEQVAGAIFQQVQESAVKLEEMPATYASVAFRSSRNTSIVRAT